MSLHRIFLIVLGFIAALFIGTFVKDALGDAPDTDWTTRSIQRAEMHQQRLHIAMAGVGVFITWVMATLVQTERGWKKHNAPDRPANPHAGSVLAELRQTDATLVAHTQARLGARGQQIEIDVARQTIVFRHTPFITSFVRNPAREEVTLRFRDLLGIRIWGGHTPTVVLRTTAGSTSFSTALKPFDPVVNVCFDIIEVNRKDPAAYREALAREPRVVVPGWCWLLIAVTVAAIAALGIHLAR